MRLLAEGGVGCLLFGGWAEEALHLRAPGPHRDIDLLLPAQSFRALDGLLAAGGSGLQPVPLKRFAHKRGILYGGVLVELTLVQQDSGNPFTLYWGDVPFEWHLPLSEPVHLMGRHVPAVSRMNLQLHRANYRKTQPWRWRDPAVRIQSSNKSRQVQQA